MSVADVRYLTFEVWWQKLKRLAERHDVPLPGHRDAYREYFEDGDPPEVAVAEEIRRSAASPAISEARR